MNVIDKMVLVGISSELDPNRLPLTTKKGTLIPNSRRPEYENFQISAAIQWGNSQSHSARFRSISDTYNCAGMVFGCRRTWIDNEDVQFILNEDGYHRVTQESDIIVGDIVVYRHISGTIEHVGIVVGVKADLLRSVYEFLILSKWGRFGEYIHAPQDVPAIYLKDTLLEYWSERKTR